MIDTPEPADLPVTVPITGERRDLRLVAVGLALWAGVLGGLFAGSRPVLVAVAAAVGTLVAGVLLIVRPARVGRRTAAVLALCLATGGALGAARAYEVTHGPVADLAAQGAQVRVDAVVRTDPQLRSGQGFGGGSGQEYVVLGVRVETIAGRGEVFDVRTPVVVIASGESWAELLPGQRVRLSGRLSPPRRLGPDAAMLRADEAVDRVGPPGAIGAMTEPLRAGLRHSVEGVEERARGLVPALVVGDESLMVDQVRDDMMATGLTHLTAVSGTNVTIVVVVVLGVARWGRMRGYALPVAGVVAVAGFVLLARPEPSVLRAAVMGVVAVIGVTVAGRRHGLAALAAAVCVLLLADPWLACTAGFGLSVLATAGILVLAPRWQVALAWLPRTLALAVVVPLAAQLACAPVVILLSGQASLVSLPANLLVAPAVVPATVLGVAAAVVSPIPVAGAAELASGLGWAAGLATGWIVRVAEWGAAQPGAVAGWPGGGWGVALAVVASTAAAVIVPFVLRRRLVAVLAAAALGVVVLRGPPDPGWPPRDWVVVACDVGQGDALVLRAGEGSGVVVDAGPEPRAVQRCLDSLGIDQVPLLVLTHFHADHVLGVPGVLAGRDVDAVLVSPLRDPVPNVVAVERWLEEAGVPVHTAAPGGFWRAGTGVSLEVLWPRRLIRSGGSAENNASVVLGAAVDGVDVLLTGDIEPEAQAALAGAEPELRADVVKVPHHGSPHQDLPFLASLDASLALVSVGDNDYGHPAGSVVRALQAAGAVVRRTDEDGSIAVVRLGGDRLAVVSGGPVAPE